VSVRRFVSVLALVLGFCWLGSLGLLAGDDLSEKHFAKIDEEAIDAFKKKDYEKALKFWLYIRDHYPRPAHLPEFHPEFVRWKAAFFCSIIRAGYTEKLILQRKPETVWLGTARYDEARHWLMSNLDKDGLNEKNKQKFLEAAIKPLEDALNPPKKVEKGEDKKEETKGSGKEEEKKDVKKGKVEKKRPGLTVRPGNP